MVVSPTVRVEWPPVELLRSGVRGLPRGPGECLRESAWVAAGASHGVPVLRPAVGKAPSFQRSAGVTLGRPGFCPEPGPRHTTLVGIESTPVPV